MIHFPDRPNTLADVSVCPERRVSTSPSSVTSGRVDDDSGGPIVRRRPTVSGVHAAHRSGWRKQTYPVSDDAVSLKVRPRRSEGANLREPRPSVMLQVSRCAMRGGGGLGGGNYGRLGDWAATIASPGHDATTDVVDNALPANDAAVCGAGGSGLACLPTRPERQREPRAAVDRRPQARFRIPERSGAAGAPVCRRQAAR